MKPRPVQKLDRESGKVLATYDGGASEAERENPGMKQPTICQACRGVRGGVVYGFKWRYLDQA